MVHGQSEVSVRFTSTRVGVQLHNGTFLPYGRCIMESGGIHNVGLRSRAPGERPLTDLTDRTGAPDVAGWRQTACILCGCNCGVEIRLGGDGRTLERTRGDKAHPASKGFLRAASYTPVRTADRSWSQW